MNKESKHGVAMKKPLTGKKKNSPLFSSCMILMSCLVAVFVLLNGIEAVAAPKSSEQKSSKLKVNSSGLLRITEKNGLFTVQADGVNLGKVMKKLSEISGSDIRFLSPRDQ